MNPSRYPITLDDAAVIHHRIKAVERLERENDLRLALENDEFPRVYQPQTDIASGEITGLEALIGWQHPKLGLVPPDKFIVRNRKLMVRCRTIPIPHSSNLKGCGPGRLNSQNQTALWQST